MDGPPRKAWVLLAAALAAALGTAAFVFRPGRVDGVSRAWMESRALGIARVVAGAAEAALDFEDPVAAQAALETLADTPDAAYAVLSHRGGRRLAAWGDAQRAREAEGEAPATYAGGLLHVRVPVEGRAGHRGVLRLGFTLGELDARVRETRALLLWLSLATLALGVAATFAVDLARRVKERTGELARTNAALAELRRTQEQLVVADRRVSLGRLAAGVGHEINNPLAFVTANLRWALDALAELRAAAAGQRPPAGGLPQALAKVEEALDDAAQGAERVRHIVRQLRTFSRSGDDAARQPMRLAEAVDVAVEMAAHEIRHRARLVREDGPSPPVLASPVRLGQVFVNLLVNAAHAIPEGEAARHEIRVRTGTAEGGAAFAEVEDTGCGIPPEVLPRLFEPFFTTKPATVGTGLGLSISRGIVRDLGGEIEVRSEPGKGSTFRVTLPPHLAPDAAAAPGPPARTPPPRRSRILVVDDELLVAQALARLLSRWHAVEVADGGRDAISRIEGGARYDHILCDLMMPDPGGPAVHAAIARAAPEQAARLVFMTGGAFTEGARSFLDGWKGPVVDKPVDVDELWRVLDAR